MMSVLKPFGALLSIILLSTLISCVDDHNQIEYPQSGEYGQNLLAIESDTIFTGDYSLHAILEEETFLDVKISSMSWAFESNSMNGNWEASPYEFSDYSRILSSLKTGEIDAEILLRSSSNLSIEVFENGDTIPTWTKSIRVIKE
ncbi:MAG: hypothetical protein P1P82_15215 [Bacteroidales bacterium]|nr:hypothetical protein [Bacteroidales bacterium]MDT8430704.1 hypothetical protein [Bacteroidales bacterium]